MKKTITREIYNWQEQAKDQSLKEFVATMQQFLIDNPEATIDSESVYCDCNFNRFIINISRLETDEEEKNREAREDFNKQQAVSREVELYKSLKAKYDKGN